MRRPTFVFVGGFGNDTIADFEAGQKAGDVIEIDHTIFDILADILAANTQIGFDLLIAVDANNSITLENVAMADLRQNEFLFVERRKSCAGTRFLGERRETSP